MATKKNNEAKCTVWTEAMKIELNGTISGCSLELFGYIRNAETREKMLQLMQARHEKMIEVENAKAKN